MKPEKACRIITACAVLHNIAILRLEPDVEGEQEEDIQPVIPPYVGRQDGQGIRNHTDMQTMVRMTTDKCESLNFYKYLCKKIGSEEVVRTRRLAYCISDMSQISGDGSIYSGSKGEGLDLKGSDLDIMFIDTNFKVYESETEVIRDGLTIPLIMNTKETKPCFTQLRLLNHHQPHQNFKYMWQKNHLGYMLSSEEYKLVYLSCCAPSPILGNIWRIHGPCLTDNNDQLDFANCLKCDQWICQAQPWISRPRTTWPTDLSRGLFALYLAKACRFAPDASKYGYSPENKHQYYKYKYDRSHLLIGLHTDAMTGWLTLASFLYVHKNYVASLRVINYALQKYTDEKIFTGLTTSFLAFIQKQKNTMNLMDKEYTFIQKHVLNLMKKEKKYTVLKAITMKALMLNSTSSIIPQELQLVAEQLHLYHPLPFAYFLSFLCYYHLHDSTSCRHYILQLKSVIAISFDNTPIAFMSTPIMCGIAHKLIGETYLARQIFQTIVDKAPGLSWLSSVM
ncbi:HARBI1 [Mytilus coruscus]|uniref:HARBI1 n=1 Tax=Mytilus coruscus TaxID=42192 RepID=A0A6J8F4A4_MYTCO|nr:HARBI1 [Mytilus coruscus]